MSQQHLRHGMLATLAVVSLSLSLLMLSRTESGMAVNHRDAPIFIYHSSDVREILLNNSYSGDDDNDSKVDTLITRSSGLSLNLLNQKATDTALRPNTAANPNIKGARMRLTQRSAARLNKQEVGTVEIPAIVKIENRRVRARAVINKNQTAGDFEIGVILPSLNVGQDRR